VRTKFTKLAKNLRNNPTDTENALWLYLKNKQIEGVKFRRQQPIGNYIVDFVSFEKQLVIELDGGQHSETVHSDEARDEWLRKEGFTVLRFWDNEIFENREGVLEIIREKCLSPAPLSPPAGGGD